MKTINYKPYYILCFLLGLVPTFLFGQEPPPPRSSMLDGDADFFCDPCNEQWSNKVPIKVIEYGPLDVVVIVTAGSKINFEMFYNDFDRVRFTGPCPAIPPADLNKWVFKECPGHQIDFTITKNADEASFDQLNNAVDMVNSPVNARGSLPPFPGSPDRINFYSNEPVALFTDPGWNSGTIKVKAEIIDNAIPVPLHPLHTITGSCQDQMGAATRRTWQVIHTDPADLPQDLEQDAGNPADADWTELWKVATPTEGAGYRQDYTYKGVIACGVHTENYLHHIANETHINSNVTFNFPADFDPAWIAANGNPANLAQAVAILFPHGLSTGESSFPLNFNEEFTDRHGFTYNFQNHVETDVFTNAAIMANNVGYVLNQEYRNANNVVLGTASITRQMRLVGGGVYDWHIQKVHAGICP